MTETVTKPTVAPAEPGDHDLFSHYVPKPELEAAILEGREATALCGKTWTPTKDPQRYPVCPECKAVWEAMDE
jgi:hypothetical protein